MAHTQNYSLDSTFSSNLLSSVSSRTSIETYQGLAPEIAKIQQSGIDLQTLVGAAQKILNDRFKPDPRSVCRYKISADVAASVSLAEVISAMLAYAPECGGDEGLRYVASAIVACNWKESESDGDVVETLVAVGTTWVTHFLFVFKASTSREATESFEDKVILRDGYKCVLTRFQAPSHPAPDPNILTAYLKASHILHRAVAQFDKDHTSRFFVTTFNILVQFTRIPIESLEALKQLIDDPSNGMTLDLQAHKSFDNFNWCLKRTETPDVYALKIFKNIGILKKPENNLITFRDHSDDFSPPASTGKRNRTTSLPNSHYISIHAAIAGILNMSGAGKFFDELLDYCRDDEGEVPPLQCWPELEDLMEKKQTRLSLAESLRVY